MLASQLLTLALSAAALANMHGEEARFDLLPEHDRNGTQQGADHRQCREIAHLARLSEFASNATKLPAYAALHNLTQPQEDEIRSKAASAQAKLAALQNNATLVRTCAVVNADNKLRAECRQMRKLSKIIEFAQNATAMAKHEGGGGSANEAKAERLRKKADMAKVKLDELQKNGSMVVACQALDTGKSTSAGVIQEKKSAAQSAFGSVDTLRVTGSMLFAAGMASLLASL